MQSISRAAAVNAKDGEYVMEYQIESERGFHVLGTAIFSANTRLPRDPVRFTSPEGDALGQRLTDYEVPDGSWVWAWSRWYVDMSSDVDDQGWCYSWLFRSKRWSGKFRFMRSFVRQRVWKRPRIKREVLERTANLLYLGAPQTAANDYTRYSSAIRIASLDDTSDLVSQSVHASRDSEREQQAKESTEYADRIIDELNSQRNDRERVDWIYNRIFERPDEVDLLIALRGELMATLRFPVSRKSLITKLSRSNWELGEKFALMPDTSWRDQVLLHGEPVKDQTDETVAESEL